jgi:hypothetical protein
MNWENESLPEQLASIPSTSEPQTLQYYKWLSGRALRGEIIELGCWLGASTYCIAAGAVCSPSRSSIEIQAYDSFIWETWMDNFTRNRTDGFQRPAAGHNYESLFEANLGSLKYMVRTVQGAVPSGCSNVSSFIAMARSHLKGKKIPLLIYDMGSDYGIVRAMWSAFNPFMVNGTTVVVLSEADKLSSHDIRRFVLEEHLLEPLHKIPRSTRSFIYGRKRGNACPL